MSVLLPDAPREAVTIGRHQFIIHPEHLFTDVWYKFLYDGSFYAVRKLNDGSIELAEIVEEEK